MSSLCEEFIIVVKTANQQFTSETTEEYNNKSHSSNKKNVGLAFI